MKRVRMLVVADQGIIARDIQRELLSLGYEPVDIAVSGEEAVRSAKIHRPHLVLMDIHLAGVMDGIEAASRIREETGISSVFLTAYASADVVERAKRARPLGYIVKPIDIQTLRSTVEIALSQDQLQRQLGASERRYRAMIQGAHDAIVTTDAAGRIVDWNHTAETMLGWAAAEVLGQSIDLIVPVSFRPERAARYAAIVADESGEFGKPLPRPAQLRDGRVIPVEISFTKWRDDGETFVSCFMRNLAERTLLEQQLRQAQKMEVVGRLAGGIAHDFNNILTVINGTCDLVMEDMAADDPHREAFTDIRDAGTRAAQLTRQLLTFSRRDITERSTISVGQLAARSASLLRRLLGEDVQLILKTDAGGRDTASLDPSQFEQVLLNLAVNARDAMPRGGTLTIRTERLEGGEWPAAVRITVSDTGIGMDESVRSHLFEPFFTTKPKGQGTGLGLATVYGVVAGLGGTITVDSTPGHGATFVITLPASDPELPVEAAASVPALARGNERVLVVEDEDSARKVTERMLRAAGYVVFAAPTGEAALAMIHAGLAVDVILTDVVMPGMSGPELIDCLPPGPRRPAVLFMSGYVGDRLDERRLAYAHYVAKPYTASTLTRRLREALGTR